MAAARRRGTAPGRRFPLAPGVGGGARREGPEDCYQPLLWRDWSPRGGFALWVGATPGEADADGDDAVTRREVALTRRHWPALGGYRRMALCDLRDSGPDGWPRRGTLPPRSPGMLELLADYAAEAEAVVLTFGEVSPMLARAASDALRVLHDAGRPLWCLGTLRSGAPRPALSGPASAVPVRWG